MGALYGPVALVWIVFGCILIGAVHDYFSGMFSVRFEGRSIPDLVNWLDNLLHNLEQSGYLKGLREKWFSSPSWLSRMK